MIDTKKKEGRKKESKKERKKKTDRHGEIEAETGSEAK